jgi:hypothetical protein
MQAHGGGIVLDPVTNLYYLIGENKQDGSSFQSIIATAPPTS